MVRSRARDVILAELKEGCKTWSQLEDACKNEGLSRGAFTFQLKKLLNKEMIVQTSPVRGRPYCLSGKQIELQTADEEELTLYLNTLLENPCSEMEAEVLRDLQELCMERRIAPITHEREKKYFTKLLSSRNQEALENPLRIEVINPLLKFWLFFAMRLNDESYVNHWELLINCLRLIAYNASKTGDEESLNFLKNSYRDRTFQLAMTPEIEMRIRYQANMFLKLVLSSEEIFNELKKRIEEVTINIIENEDELWSLTINPACDVLRDVYKEKRPEVKKWIYQRFLKSDIERVRKRGVVLNSALRSSERSPIKL